MAPEQGVLPVLPESNGCFADYQPSAEAADSTSAVIVVTSALSVAAQMLEEMVKM